MKKLASLLLTLVFLVSVVGTAFAKAPAAKVTNPKSGTGIVKTFTDKTVKLNVGGKDYTYNVSLSTKVEKLGVPVAFADEVKKGLAVAFKADGTKLTYLDVPQIGSENQGNLKIKSTDINVTRSDSPFTAPAVNLTKANNQTKEDAGTEEATNYLWLPDPNEGYGTEADKDTITLGYIDVLPETIKATLNGKEVKILTDAKAEFDTASDQPQAKYFVKKELDGATDWPCLKFNQILLEDATKTTADVQKFLQVTYTKKMYKATQYDIVEFPFSENVLAELNGKEVPLVRALNRSTYSLFRTNLEGDVIYVNAYYKELQCKIDSISGDKIKVSKITDFTKLDSRVIFSDTLTINKDVVAVYDETGNVIDLSTLKKDDLIKVTVDPYDNYNVSEISKFVAK